MLNHGGVNLNKLKSLITALSIVLLTVFTLECTPQCEVKAEFNIEDETLALVNEVVCLDIMEENATYVMEMRDEEYRGLTQKRAGVPITYDVEKMPIRVECSFLNNNLRMIFISGFDSIVENFSVSETVEKAKGFLQRYQNYTGDAVYGQFASMLEGVNATEDTTKYAENVRLEVLNHDQVIVDYIWRYVDDNGIVAKLKSVNLNYDRGNLIVFLNQWPLFNIGGTPEISAEEATEIAIEAANTYSYEATTENGTETITGFDIAQESLGHETLSYVNFPNPDIARDREPFTLYPSWYVPIGFNKSYPNGVTGITVTVWADTGEISTINPMVVVLVPEFPSCAVPLIMLFAFSSLLTIYTNTKHKLNRGK